MTGHPKLDIVRFEVADFTKSSNKDMIPKFEELEKMRFKGHKKAYDHICEVFGSAFFSCVYVFINEEKKSYWDLRVN